MMSVVGLTHSFSLEDYRSITALESPSHRHGDPVRATVKNSDYTILNTTVGIGAAS